MKLLLDLGNTRLKCAVESDGDLGPAAIFDPADASFSEDFSIWLEARAGVGTTAWLAAVAPELAVVRTMDALQRHGIEPRRVITTADALGVRIAYRDPARFGVDRWLNLLAARARTAGPALVVSVGTALTIDALQAGGLHLGGLIAPTPEIARAALVARAPRLDVGAGRIVRFADTTEDAVASGTVLAAVALIESAFAELERLAESPPALFLTGGGAGELRAWLPAHTFVADLVLRGLAAWAATEP